MKNILILLLLFSIQSSFSQKDSIVNFLDIKGKTTKIKNEARSFEIFTKVNDSLWKLRRYRKNGSLYSLNYFKTRSRKNKIGQYFSYNRQGRLVSSVYYNSEGKRHGKARKWFDNGNFNTKGIFFNGRKEGVWKFYHYNGELSSRLVFKNDSILRATYFDEKGTQVEFKGCDCKFKEPKFKRGKSAFEEKLKKLVIDLGYDVRGKIFVNFIVDIEGNIKDVTIDEDIPHGLKNKIVSFFKRIKGWEPATHANRKVPYSFSIPLNFT